MQLSSPVSLVIIGLPDGQISRGLLVLQVLGFLGNDDAKRYIFDGEITLEKIKVPYLV